MALLTAMRSGEILSLTWGSNGFRAWLVTVGRAKTAAGTGRQVPMNADLLTAHADWFQTRVGEPTPGNVTESCRRPLPSARPAAYGYYEAGRSGRARGHDACARRAMSRTILERYSHVRLNAKRDAWKPSRWRKILA
ncbi:MAG: hypothetical protein HYZ57_14465 [Acidobacteria bacterium]|nr:hypothetical protein [Acidobacteriota bacterium]MBI3281036.1 hypothetical protein [Acidobacteriota bacterium]